LFGYVAPWQTVFVSWDSISDDDGAD